MKKILRSPWAIATYTIFGTYLLSLTKISFFVNVWKWFDYKISIPIWLIITVLAIFLLLILKFNKKTSTNKQAPAKNRIPLELTNYTEDTFEGIKYIWRWYYNSFQNRWEIDGFMCIHPEDNGEIIQDGWQYCCSKCEKSFNLLQFEKVKALIRNNMRSKYNKK